MNFVQIGFLSAFAALMIPVIVHLLFKRRSRTVQLGTLRFLRAVIEENSRRKKLKRWMLLLLRLGAVAALVVLFARPYIAEQKKAGDGRHLILLLDRSATMQLQNEGQRLVDLAMAQAREVLKAADEDAGVDVAWFDHSVTPVSDSKSVPGSLTLEAPEQCFGSTNYGAALMWARDRMLASDATKKELYIFTD
ncbi:MAG: BatA domain-containing protein, partial [Planctomycetaceae bacterium]|nr:BatA domain-containing protein [Planctomycetaceae bacterium]